MFVAGGHTSGPTTSRVPGPSPNGLMELFIRNEGRLEFECGGGNGSSRFGFLASCEVCY